MGGVSLVGQGSTAELCSRAAFDLQAQMEEGGFASIDIAAAASFSDHRHGQGLFPRAESR